MVRQNGPTSTIRPVDLDREMPVGSELLIAFTLGMAGWWVIVHAVLWFAR